MARTLGLYCSCPTGINRLYTPLGYHGPEKEPWVGYDFDGTLVEDHTKWEGPETCGADIVPMCKLLAKDLEQGKRVKLFTARATSPESIREQCIQFLQHWSLIRFGMKLEVTAVKDFYMVHCYDDRFTNPNTILK